MIRFSALIFAALPLSAHAMTEGECADLWGRAQNLVSQMGPTQPTLTSDSVGRLEGEWCVVDAVIIESEDNYSPRFNIEQLRYRGAGMVGLFDWSVPPTSLDIEMDGLNFGVRVDEPVMDYLIAAQRHTSGTDVAVSMVWDAGSKTVALTKGTMDFPGENAISVTARAKNVDLGTKGRAQMAMLGFGVTEMDVSVTSNGLFESYFLMPIGAALLTQDTDPAAQVDALKMQAAAMIASLPDATFSADTKAAMNTVIGEFPNPAGKLDLILRSEAGVGPRSLAGYALLGVPTTIAALAPMFDGLTVGATYTPTAQAD